VFVVVNQFFEAIHQNDISGVKQLLEAGGCKNLINLRECKTGLSPLMTAAHAGAL